MGQHTGGLLFASQPPPDQYADLMQDFAVRGVRPT